MTVARNNVEKLTRELVEALNDLTGLHGEVLMHMRNKLAAIRKADTDAIASITAREMTLMDRVIERETARRQTTKKLVYLLGQQERFVEPVKLTALAEHLPEPQRSQLLGASMGLREKLKELEQTRVTTTLVTQEMLKHLKQVMTVMTSGGPGSDVYGRTGQRQSSNAAHVFEAVG